MQPGSQQKPREARLLPAGCPTALVLSLRFKRLWPHARAGRLPARLHVARVCCWSLKSNSLPVTTEQESPISAPERGLFPRPPPLRSARAHSSPVFLNLPDLGRAENLGASAVEPLLWAPPHPRWWAEGQLPRMRGAQRWGTGLWPLRALCARSSGPSRRGLAVPLL